MNELLKDVEQLSREERDQALKEFKNGTPHKFHDISAERLRIYHYPDGSKVEILHPLLLNTNYKSGGHRVYDAFQCCHYVQGGWNHIAWRVYEGEDHFSK